MPEGREVHRQSRDLLTGLRKCKRPLSSPFTLREWEDPFSGAQIASGEKIKCLREPQVQANVSAGPADGLFINCCTGHSSLYLQYAEEANLVQQSTQHQQLSRCANSGICPGNSN